MGRSVPWLDAASAISYLGKSVLMELYWEGEAESYGHLAHIIGVVLPMTGINPHAYFLIVALDCDERRDPYEVHLSDIRAIGVVKGREQGAMPGLA